MLKVFRDNIKYLSWILWLVIALFVLFVFVDFGSGRLGSDQTDATAAATVGAEKVSVEEFRRAYERYREQYRQIYGEQFEQLEKQLQLPVQVLNQLVNRRILLAEARRMGLAVGDAEVRQEILSFPAFKDDAGNFVGAEQYASGLRRMGYTPASFEEAVREDLLLKRLDEVLAAGVFVADDEVERAYREEVERAKIRYVRLGTDAVAAGAQVSESEIATYYESHKDEWRTGEQREGSYLLIDRFKLAAQSAAGDQEVERYYREHPSEFTREEEVRARHILVMVNDQRTDAEAKARIEQARERLLGGADFAALSNEISDDSNAKANGGDLGYFARNRMVKEFEEAAFKAPLNQLVGPVKTSFGYHLLEVTDKRQGGVQPLAEVRDQIRSRLSAERAQQLAQTRADEAAERLAKQRAQGVEALNAAAKENPAYRVVASGKFGQQGTVAELGSWAPLTTAAFAMKKGEMSKAIEVPTGWAVFYLSEIHPPRVPPLPEIADRVRVAAVQQKRRQLTMDRLTQARSQIAGGKTFDQVAAELGLNVESSEELGADGAISGLGSNPELAKAALALSAGQVGPPIADREGAVLFEVVERKTWDPAKFAEAKAGTLARLKQEKLGRYQAALLEQRRRELGVKLGREVLANFDIELPAGS
jgi:peptidyl-prolyl cis-trans isomerase D